MSNPGPSSSPSTVHITVLPATTLLISTRSGTQSSTSSQSLNPTIPAASIGEPSFAVPKEPASQTNREHVIIVLMFIIAFFLLFFFAFYLFRRSRMSSRHRQELLDEEERIEVSEARAFWPMDETLKEGYHSARSIESAVPTMPQPPPSIASTGAYPRYHPGIKRSRTLPPIRPIQYPLPRSAKSYPRSINDQPTNPKSPSSSVSISIYLKPEPKPMSLSTTMQTRRPEPLHPPTPINRSESPDSFLDRQIHSFWSISPTASIAPSSPSLYAPPSPSMIREPDALRPRPTFRESPQTTYSPLRSPSPTRKAPESGTYPMFSAEREASPTLQPSKLPRFRQNEAIPSTALIPLSAPQFTPPMSPFQLRSPTPPTPPIPRSPKSPRSPRHPKPPVPRCKSPDCPLQPSLETDDIPVEQIESWLDGSARTLSAFGSLFHDDLSTRPPKPDSSPLAQTEDNSDEVLRKDNTTSRVSPIRGMRSSASRPRKGSTDTIGTAI